MLDLATIRTASKRVYNASGDDLATDIDSNFEELARGTFDAVSSGSQAEINESIQNVGDGTVLIRAGTYDLTGRLIFGTNKIHLKGEGMGKTVLRLAPSFANFALIYDFTEGLSDIEISGITFDANGVNNKGLIELGQCSNVRVHNCEFRNVSASAAHWSVRIGTLDDEDIDGSASYNVRFTDNWIHDNENGTHETVLPINCRNSEFNFNLFEGNDNTAYTFNLFGYCHGSQVIGNRFVNTRDPIFILSCLNVTCSHNYVDSQALDQYGVTIHNSAYVDVSHNILDLYDNGSSGNTGIDIWDRTGSTFDGHPVVVDNSYAINVEGNVISNAQFGVAIGQTQRLAQSDIAIHGNLIQGCRRHPIFIGRDSTSNGIHDIHIYGNTIRDHRNFNGGGITILGNTADPTDSHSFYVRDNHVEPGLVTGADVTGIFASAVSGLYIERNFVLGTGRNLYAGEGLVLTDGAVLEKATDNVGFNGTGLHAQGNVTGATTFNRVNGDVITATLTGNITVTLIAGAVAGDELTLILTQDGTGSRLATWPSNFKKAGGTLTLSTGAAAVDVIKMRWDGTNWREVSRSLNLS